MWGREVGCRVSTGVVGNWLNWSCHLCAVQSSGLGGFVSPFHIHALKFFELESLICVGFDHGSRVVRGRAGVVVVTRGRCRWGVQVGAPIPVVPVFGHPVVIVSKLMDELVCVLRGFLGLVVFAVEPLGLVSFLIDHALELFELAQFVVVVYEVTALMYLAFASLKLLNLVLNPSILVCLIPVFLSSFPVHPGISSVVYGLFELLHFAFSCSVLLVKLLGCVLMVCIIVVLVFVLAAIRFILIRLA